MSSSFYYGNDTSEQQVQSIKHFFRAQPKPQAIVNDPVINGVNVYNTMAQAIPIRSAEDLKKFQFLNGRRP